MWSGGARAAAFVGLFLALSAGLSVFYTNVVMARGLLLRVDRDFHATAPVRLLIAGDSHPQRAVDPRLLPDAFNFSSAGENYAETFYKLRHVLTRARKQIDTVLLPFDLHSFSSYKSDRARYAFYWIRYVDYLELGRRKGELPAYLMKQVQGRLFAYAGDSRDVLRVGERLLDRQSATSPVVKGFVASDVRLSDDPNAPRAEIAAANHHLLGEQPLDPVLVFYFERSLELCRTQGVRVVLVKYPVSAGYFARAAELVDVGDFYARLAAILNRHPGVTLLDHQADFFGSDESFFDPDHLNARSAGILSGRIARELAGEPASRAQTAELRR